MAKALVGGRVIDGTGRDPIDDAVVLIDGDRIDAVFRRGDMELPAGTEVVDVTGSTVIPGLIDCHVHVGVLADNSFLQVEDPGGTGGPVHDHVVEPRRDDRAGHRELRSRRGVPHLQGRPGELAEVLRCGNHPGRTGRPARPVAVAGIIDDEESARREAAKLIDAGMDFLKVYVVGHPSGVAGGGVGGPSPGRAGGRPRGAHGHGGRGCQGGRRRPGARADRTRVGARGPDG